MELVLGLNVSMPLDAAMEMDAPVTIGLTLVNESGRKLARGTARLVANAVGGVWEPEAAVQLRTTVMPSFSMRFLTNLPPEGPTAAAVPALHLLVTVLQGSVSNLEIVRSLPISLKVAGGGGGPSEALKECARRGVGDLVELAQAFLHVVAAADAPGDPTPGELWLTVDMDDDGVPETDFKGQVRGSDFTDGLQKNEVVILDWVATRQGQEVGQGGNNFVKLSDDGTFRMSITQDMSLSLEPACGPFEMSMLGIHLKHVLPHPTHWFGSAGFRATTTDGESMDAVAWFEQYADSVRVTGTTRNGQEVLMDIPFDSP